MPETLRWARHQDGANHRLLAAGSTASMHGATPQHLSPHPPFIISDSIHLPRCLLQPLAHSDHVQVNPRAEFRRSDAGGRRQGRRDGCGKRRCVVGIAACCWRAAWAIRDGPPRLARSCSRLVEGRAAATAERLRRLRRRQAAACPYSICRMRRLSSWQAAAA